MSSARGGVLPARRRLLVAMAAATAARAVPAASGDRSRRLAADAADRLDAAWQLAPGDRVDISPAAVGRDLAGTLAAVARWSVPHGALLVIRLGAGRHPQRGTIVVRHADGARLQIVGEPSDPSQCRLAFSGPADGVYVGAGCVLGGLDAMVIEHAAPRDRGAGSGVLADEGGSLICGPALAVHGFYYGFQARRNGSIRCEATRATGGGDANYFAFMGGHLSAKSARADGARDAARHLGSGFVAEYGGSIDAEKAQASGNALAGFVALSNGAIRAYGSRAVGNGSAGYLAEGGGSIVAHGALAQDNCGEAYARRGPGDYVGGSAMASQDNGPAAKGCAAR